MADEEIMQGGDEAEDVEIYTLVDENGVECQFECIARYDEGDSVYFAMLPIDENESDEYVILKLETDEDGEQSLVSVDDDAEFDKISDIFDDMLFSEVDYDEEEQ